MDGGRQVQEWSSLKEQLAPSLCRSVAPGSAPEVSSLAGSLPCRALGPQGCQRCGPAEKAPGEVLGLSRL